jgi:hypothetical protein
MIIRVASVLSSNWLCCTVQAMRLHHLPCEFSISNQSEGDADLNGRSMLGVFFSLSILPSYVC